MVKFMQYIWASPNTILGLPFLFFSLFPGGVRRIVDGTVETESYLGTLFLKYLVPLRGGAQAITLGHIIVGQNQHCLNNCRKHEQVHVRQCERWGVFFLPAYALSSLSCLLTGRNPYLDNHFEKEARQLSE